MAMVIIGLIFFACAVVGFIALAGSILYALEDTKEKLWAEREQVDD